MPVVRSPVLVGRAAELATVRRLVEALQHSVGATLLVTGEAGIGKSRLVAELAARAVEAHVSVLTGRTVEGGDTYRALAEALARPLRAGQLRDSPRLRPYRAALSRFAPRWAGTDEAANPGRDVQLDLSVVLGEGVLALLHDLHGGAGCVLVLEDLHWADADTLDLVCYLADAVPGTPVLLALTARDEFTAAGLARLVSHPAITTLHLIRLEPAAVGTLAAACRGGEPVSEPELHQLVARSDRAAVDKRTGRCKIATISPRGVTVRGHSCGRGHP